MKKLKEFTMNLSRHLIILATASIILTSTWAIAQPPSYTTAGAFNGHMWQLLSNSQKASHLSGIQEGIKLCLNQIKEDLHISAELMSEIKESGLFDRRRLLFSSQGISGIEAGIDKFYQDSANLEIPIMDAYQHVTLELNYASANELANNLSSLRRKYHGQLK
jgi:hypothetical protein